MRSLKTGFALLPGLFALTLLCAAHPAGAQNTIDFEHLTSLPATSAVSSTFAAANSGSNTFGGVTFDTRFLVFGLNYSAHQGGANLYGTPGGNYALTNGDGSGGTGPYPAGLSGLTVSTSRLLTSLSLAQNDYGTGSFGSDKVTITSFGAGGDLDTVSLGLGSGNLSTLSTGNAFLPHASQITGYRFDAQLAPDYATLGAGGGHYVADNLAFAAAHAWMATAVSVGSDGSTRLLWNKNDGTALFWTINGAGSVTNSPPYGPYSGWNARAIATDKNNNSRLLWNNVNGQASLWSVSPGGTASSVPAFGPYAGWAATGLSVGPDGRARLAWNNSGQGALWIVNSAGGADITSNYGPYAGWAIQSISTGPDNNTRLLWDKTDGSASLWGVTPAGAVGSAPPTYGPYAGWTARAIASGPDNRTWVLWTKTDGTATLWVVNGSGGIDSAHDFGPYAGWEALALAVGPDGKARLLWDNADGTAAVWSVTASGAATSSPYYGPY